MGLDISFNKEAAVKAGLVLEEGQRGTEEAVERTRKAGDKDYLGFLTETCTFMTIPDYDYCTEASVFEERVIVRANKWGRLYGPLTAFLKANDIPWEEFA